MKNTLSKNSLIVDSGFWVALHNRKDRWHTLAMQAFRTFELDTFLTTWPVMAEASHLLYGRIGFEAQMLFLKNIQRGGADIFHLDDEDHLPRMQELMEKYRDLPMDLADASLVILTETLGHGRILSTDQRDFNAYRWKNHEPFENLLLRD